MGLFIAWAIGEVIIFARWGRAGAPPTPGVLAMSSVLFAGCAAVAVYPPARPVATAFAYAVDLGVLLQVVGKAPQDVTGWPPPAIPDTSILPPGAASGSRGASAPAKAGASNPPPGIAREIWGWFF